MFAQHGDALLEHPTAQEITLLHLRPGQFRIVRMMVENHAHTTQSPVRRLGVLVQDFLRKLRVLGQMYIGDDAAGMEPGIHLGTDETCLLDRVDDGAARHLPHDGFHMYAGDQFEGGRQLPHISQIIRGDVSGQMFGHGSAEIGVWTFADVPQMKVRITDLHADSPWAVWYSLRTRCASIGGRGKIQPRLRMIALASSGGMATISSGSMEKRPVKPPMALRACTPE